MSQSTKGAHYLTEGPIVRSILAFAMPLFWGQLFQQLYNTADTLIVGNFLGSKALASVASSGSMIFLMVGFFNGIAIGAGVVIARYYGAGDRENLRKAIHTTLTFGAICGILLSLVGVITVPTILRWMNTPEEVLPGSIRYFRIYFCGSLAFVLYNFLVGILQSVGDSRHPLYYLMFSSVLNIILDIVFIGVLGFGVGAAAFATIISQFTSAILCLIRLRFRSPEEYRLNERELGLDPMLLRQIIRNGLPTGIQNSVISIANVFVQTNINAFGSAAMAGCGSYSKIEGFGFLPVMSFSMALTTFVSQNLGAGRYDRVKKGGFTGLLIGTALAEMVGLTIYVFCPDILVWFNRETEVVNFGITMGRTVTPFFFLCGMAHLISGILRGAGKSAVPMGIMLAIWCGVRITYIYFAVQIWPRITTVFWAYPLTWSLSVMIFLYYLLGTDWVHGYPKRQGETN